MERWFPAGSTVAALVAGLLFALPAYGDQGSGAGEFTNAGGTVLFSATDGIHGWELWRTNGTAAGTRLVRDINPGSADSNPTSFEAVGTHLYFTADDGVHGSELWKSDGTTAGTRLVSDIRPGRATSAAGPLTAVGRTVFFRADDGAHGYELWATDGTAAGTRLLRNINPSSAHVVTSGPTDLTAGAGNLFFSADDGIHGRELWRSDGTRAGTRLVRDINSSGDSDPHELTNVAGTLFLAADDGSRFGRELWRSDGTHAGTRLVRDINTSSGHLASSFPAWLTNVAGTLFFRADDDTHGSELWRSDGTAAGTRMVRDIDTFGSESSFPLWLTNVGGTLFFSASGNPFGSFSGNELWRSDGTAAGTRLVRNIAPGGTSSDPEALTNVAGTVLFRADDGTHDYELWRSDGTAAGTRMVRDIRPDPATFGSFPDEFTNVGGTVFFSANNGTLGVEPWRSNGTAAGTRLVRNINRTP